MVASASLSRERSAATAPDTSARLGSGAGAPPEHRVSPDGRVPVLSGPPRGEQSQGAGGGPTVVAERGLRSPRPSVRAVTRRWERSLFLAGE